MNSILKKANEILHSRKLTCKGKNFQNVVEVHHGDGSYFMFKNAMSKIRVIEKFRILLVWTEHCGYYSFFCDDLEDWKTYNYQK